MYKGKVVLFNAIPIEINFHLLEELGKVTSFHHTYLFYREVAYNNLKPIKLCRKGLSISHLFFVDDLLLFGETTIAHMNIINNCLDVLCSL
ncbi:hypothetical protein CR513_14239, partial [Mucuna pruriens]